MKPMLFLIALLSNLSGIFAQKYQFINNGMKINIELSRLNKDSLLVKQEFTNTTDDTIYYFPTNKDEDFIQASLNHFSDILRIDLGLGSFRNSCPDCVIYLRHCIYPNRSKEHSYIVYNLNRFLIREIEFDIEFLNTKRIDTKHKQVFLGSRLKSDLPFLPPPIISEYNNSLIIRMPFCTIK